MIFYIQTRILANIISNAVFLTKCITITRSSMELKFKTQRCTQINASGIGE